MQDNAVSLEDDYSMQAATADEAMPQVSLETSSLAKEGGPGLEPINWLPPAPAAPSQLAKAKQNLA